MLDKHKEFRAHYTANHLRYKRALRDKRFQIIADRDDPAGEALREGRCYLCGNEFKNEQNIHLDHDHECCALGKSCEVCLRGGACNNCNVLVGLAYDDPDRLRRIANNLEEAKILFKARR